MAISTEDLAGSYPVAVGVATAEQWPTEPGEGVDCAALMCEAARAAVGDTGNDSIASMVDLVLATQGLSMLTDAGRVAHAVGAPDAQVVTYQVGIPQQALINRAIEAVLDGSASAALIVGGETKRRDDLARRAGVELPPLDVFERGDDELIAPEGEIVARPEIDIGAVAPVQQCALIDSARRAAAEWTLDEHRDDIAAVWESFNEVARTNPKAAFPEARLAAWIREPGEANRMLAFPYNKWHNSQWGVDQAAAILITSTAAAELAGIAPDRSVYPLVALESSQSLSLSRRADLHRWPRWVCSVEWPRRSWVSRSPQSNTSSSTRVSRPLSGCSRPNSVRPRCDGHHHGGMPFAGGPFNNFVFQATVAMVECLRERPGSEGLVTAVSGLLTKPGLTVWGTDPSVRCTPSDLVADVQASTDVAPLDEDPRCRGDRHLHDRRPPGFGGHRSRQREAGRRRMR